MKETITYKKLLLSSILLVLLIWSIFNYSVVGNLLNYIISLMLPFIIGIFIALIINIPMKFFNNKLFKNIKRNKMKELFSILLSIILIIFIMVMVFVLIVPEFLNVVNLLIDNVPFYQGKIKDLISNIESNNSNFDLSKMETTITNNLDNIKSNLVENMPTILTSSIRIVKGFVGIVADSIIGFVFAIYILLDKQNLKIKFEKVCNSYLKNSISKKIIHVWNLFVSSFSNFFSAHCLEATILGTLCIIGLLLLKIPYAIPIGVLVGVTALIPIVGAFIGMIVGAILIVTVSPIKVLVFLIFVFILQQVEGNIIYPKVVGNKVGLPAIWVLFAITIGGSLFGIIGMFLAVPIMSVIYILIEERIS